MPETPENPFQATMRIEIPPDLDLKEGVGKKADLGARPDGRKVIRLKKPSKDVEPAGAADFQALLQNIYDAVIITDANGQVVNANGRALQFFGYELGEFVSLNVLHLISGATEDLMPTIRRALQGDRFVLMQASCRRKDDTLFPAEISVNRLPLTAADCLSFFVRNITLRKEAEERLKTSDTAIRNSGSGIAAADLAGKIQFCNPAVLRLWGLAAEEAAQSNIRDFLADPKLFDEMNVAVRTGEDWSREVTMRRKDGATFFAQASVVPNVNPDGDLIGLVMSLLDISTLKKAQAELEDYAEKLHQRNAEMEGDLQMAREVQLAFLPQEYPVFPPEATPENAALGFSHLYYPSGIVGGDFFYILRFSPTLAGIMIGDVTGHGAKAALVVATIRGLIEQLGGAAQDPGELLTQLNRAYRSIFSHTAEMMFTTVQYLVIDIENGWVLAGSAGHLPPFRLRRANGSVEQMALPKGIQGPGLGLTEGHLYRSTEFEVQNGDILFLYTDGLSDVIDAERRFYDSVRLSACLRENMNSPPADLLKAIVADARRFSGRQDFEDDLCLLAVELRRLGRPPAR